MSVQKEYQICTKCIMDTMDPDIEFDGNGVCNHCRGYDEIAKKYVFTGKERKQKLSEIVNEIKKQGKNQEYDCILGLSGGVDSTYVVYLAKKLELRPLTVHVDNTWDSEVAVKNIENIVKKLSFDLYTCVIDWEEFRDLQRSYFKASVVDIEVLTDHAIFAAIHKLAVKRSIKYILTGCNIVTEVIMPRLWYYSKSDTRNIKAIQKIFGTRKIKSFPLVSTLKREYYKRLIGIKTINILDYVEYNKAKAMRILEKELNWKYYGGKHYESIFTRFCQLYILPKKFGIDKRRAHFSNLICSGQMTRQEVLEEMKKDLYPLKLLEKDKKYVLNKLGFSEKEFEELMHEKPRSHLYYPNEDAMLRRVRYIKKLLKPFYKKQFILS